MMNPVIQSDLIGVLRLLKTLAMQVGSAVVLSLLVWLHWPTDARADLSGMHAQDVFRIFGYGLFLTTLLLVPAFPATSIIREKQSRTLELLLNSPLSSFAIYFGKLIGVLGVAFLPLLMSIPAACACFVMGALSLSDLLRLYGVLMMLTIQFTAMALRISSFSESADAALRITYGAVFLLTVVTMGPYQFVHGQPWPMIVDAALWIRSLSPLPAIMEILGHGDVGLQGLVGTGGAPLRYSILAGITTVAFSVHTIMRLTPHIFDRSRSQGVITDDRSRSQQWLRRLLFLVDPQRRSSEIGRFTNPVLIKEFRTRRFGRSHWTLRIIILCGLVSLGLTYVSSSSSVDWGPESVGGLMVVLQVGLTVLLTPGLAAGLLSAERETGGLALLQITPLSPLKILSGKLMSAVLTTLIILLATLPGYLVMLYIESSLRQQVISCIDLSVPAGRVRGRPQRPCWQLFAKNGDRHSGFVRNCQFVLCWSNVYLAGEREVRSRRGRINARDQSDGSCPFSHGGPRISHTQFGADELVDYGDSDRSPARHPDLADTRPVVAEIDLKKGVRYLLCEAPDGPSPAKGT